MPTLWNSGDEASRSVDDLTIFRDGQGGQREQATKPAGSLCMMGEKHNVSTFCYWPI